MRKRDEESLDELLAEAKYYMDEPSPEPAPPRPRPVYAAPPQKRRRRRRPFRNFLVIILALLLVFVFLCQPRAWLDGKREPLCSTVLLCGTDESGLRTDTMMLVRIDALKGDIALLSIPRDTLVHADWSAPKLNAAYGWYGADEKGASRLLDYTEELLGFRPDGCAVVTLDVFPELVDLMGGVDFDVPMDMYYSDPVQDLYIDLRAGYQHLDGAQAIQLCRFRSGYATADIGRISVQRDFIAAALSQWARPANVTKLPGALSLARRSLTTDLSAPNILWLGAALLRCGMDDVRSETLPGEARMINGTSYYVADAAGIAALSNELFSPYTEEISAGDLVVRTG